MSAYHEISTEAVQAMMAFGAEILDGFMINDPIVRERVCRTLLADSSFIDHTGQKYDFVMNVLDQQNGENEFGINSKPTVTVGGGLSHTQRAVILANNPDYIITFIEGVKQPHPLAYAQRVVDTHRCRSEVTHKGPTILDIGGNYATHAAQGHFNIHSCTLLDDTEEMHRQTQRDVNLELMGITGVNMCTVGVQNCEVAAVEGISLHTIPRIPPGDMPKIFHQHGLKFLTGVHHYDPLMHSRSSGFLPDVEMHWRIEGDNVRFFFDNDSSLDYVHPLAYLLSYSASMYIADAELSFLVYYKVERIANGNLYWTMQRLEKATLGIQVLPPQYQYTSDDEVVTLQVPVYDPTSVFPITDPRSYVTKTKAVPLDLFTYVYQFGMANDTANPEKPLSFSDIRDATQTFNFTRKVNGTSITVNTRLSTDDAEEVAMGIYLVVVQKEAQLRVVSTEYSKMFMRIQKSWGDENFAYLVSKCFSKVAIAPYLMLAKSFESCVDLVAVHMRSVVRSSKVLAAVTSELPYFVVSPVRLMNTQATTDFAKDNPDLEKPVAADIEVADVQAFYDNFHDQLDEAAKDYLLSLIAKTTEKPEIPQEEIVVNEFPEVFENNESLEAAIDYVHERVSAVPVKSQTCTLEELHEASHYRIFEAGLYNLDLALAVIAMATARCSETWSGTAPNLALVQSRNSTTDVGMKYVKLNAGRVVDPTEVAEYAVGMDPISKSLFAIHSQNDQEYQTTSDYLFFVNGFKIFNGFKLSRNLINFSRHMKKPKQFELILVDGVPGCGKTYEILKNFKTGDSIYCAVRSTADEIREKVEKKNMTNVDPRKRVKTTDSAVMNGTMLSTTLFIDEGLMLAPGTVDFLGQSTRTKQIRIYGDSAQIGPIDRSSHAGMLRFPRIVMWTSIEFRNVSYRVPGDICVLMRRFYPPERRHLIKTYNSIRRSVKMIHQPEPTAVDYTKPEPGVLTMSFLVADKEKLANRPGFFDLKKHDKKDVPSTGAPLVTVHEAQGKDTKHSKVVRMSVFENPGFEMPEHQLVAFTRHTHTLSVVSTMPNDPYMRLAKAAINVTEEELDDAMLPTPEELKERFA